MVKRVRREKQLFGVTVSSLPPTALCCGNGMSLMVRGARGLGEIDPNENFKFHENNECGYEEINFRMWLPRDLTEQGSIEIRMNMILDAIKVAIDENRFKKDFRIQAEALVAEMHRLLVDGCLHVVD